MLWSHSSLTYFFLKRSICILGFFYKRSICNLIEIKHSWNLCWRGSIMLVVFLPLFFCWWFICWHGRFIMILHLACDTKKQVNLFLNIVVSATSTDFCVNFNAVNILFELEFHKCCATLQQKVNLYRYSKVLFETFIIFIIAAYSFLLHCFA